MYNIFVVKKLKSYFVGQGTNAKKHNCHRKLLNRQSIHVLTFLVGICIFGIKVGTILGTLYSNNLCSKNVL